MANSLNMIEMALAVVKDQAMIINLRKIEDAQRDFLLAEADQNLTGAITSNSSFAAIIFSFGFTITSLS